MTTPTNWPDPERAGYPMFPGRDGWHVLQYYVVRNGKEMPMGDPVLSWWEAHLSVWRLKPEGQVFAPPDQVSKDTVKYVAPVLTPTQIAEMLVAERERCLEAFSSHGKRAELAWNGSTSDEEKQYWRGALNTFEECCDEIRNLGDAP